MPTQLALLLEQSQTDVGSFLTNLMTSIDLDWGRFETEWEAFKAKIPEPWKLNNDGREFKVGERMRDRGLRAEYPVVLVPGIISTSLESWSTREEYRGWFREKVWGGLHMVTQVTFNKDKWMNAVMLDPITGLDPPGVKVRAAQGIDAASSFVQGYWIWSKIVENLAVVGYDPNNLLLAAYDWRLSYWNLEERDGYFSRLKASIEEMRKRHDKKVVLVAHSMGSSVFVDSMKWVESPRFGGGGPTWVEDHIESFISVAGTHLFVPKAMTAFLSGEMKDTVELNPTGAYVLERFFSRKERAKLFRTWAGSASMWIKGGNAIWGNHTHSPDDPDNCTEASTHGRFLSFRPSEILGQNALEKNNEGKSVSADVKRNLTAEEAGNWILEHADVSFQKMMESNYSCGIERDEKKLKANDDDPRKWSNPLESRLPNAPSMKIYCVYGHGKETERSYWYARGEYEYDESFADAQGAVCEDSEAANCTTPRAPLDLPLSRRNWIDYGVQDEGGVVKTKNGVKLGEGDGTVSLLSLGAMCVEGWKRKRWNPGGVKVITTELPHLPTSSIPRGGANTSDHVDILGSTGLNELIVKVATGAGEELYDVFVSRIREYAAKVQWD
ncbi:Lecithin:cholesterol acyltransferase [Fomitiporia mediterranea MF3/22]|uniref:Lecithin:cholesterol acyltransferase n=1 Tax=Fomitiporia mediterranea (strain MF3/22) TaxID=694068 RepID=UPI0004407C58|nr:Lecithin:cholesterol acyltransferase [Fomitiporia mediterranea MF3/22]EJD08429.1 Lecithin:cholesterol acyltransferase [Fomitiporia mediterranea MF3/22]